MATLPHKAFSASSITLKVPVLSLSLVMVASTLFAAPSALAQQGTSTTSETAGPQEQQTIVHITKDGTNSYLISGGSSSIGTFDTGYRIVGERSAVRASEELIITTITEDFRRSPTIGYVRAGTTTTNTGGPTQDTTNGATLPSPFATPEQITERITSELRRVIGSAENNTPEGQFVEIKCDFGMTLDDMRCFQASSVGETGGTTRPPPTNNTGGGGNTTEPLTVQAIIDIDQDATSVVVFEASIDGGTSPYTCDWDLGDNATSDACNVSHIYDNPGTYTATVTVTDSVGQTASDTTGPFTITNTTGGGETTARPPPPTTNATAGGETTTPETTAPPPTTGEGEESTTTPPPPPGTTTPDTQDEPLSDPNADRPAPPTTGGGAETTTSPAEPLDTLGQ